MAFASNVETQKSTFVKWVITGIGLRGLPEETGTDAESVEKDKSAMEDVLTHIGVSARIVDVQRVGEPNGKPVRPLIFGVDSVWPKRTILLLLVKMKSYS